MPQSRIGKPDPSDIQGIRRYARASRTRPTAVDLFCGAGGLSLGLERAGFDVLAGADTDEWAVRTHHANLAGQSWCGDLTDPEELLRTLEVWGIHSVDLVAGGVPCQPFSRAGAPRIRDLIATGERADHDARADLWSSFVTVVERLRPAAVLVENVPDLPRWDDGAVLLGLYGSLQALGYRVEARILDSFRHGVPQHRQRLILIGLDGHRQPLWPAEDGGLVSLRDAIGDLPPIPRAQRSERLTYDPRRVTSDFQRLMRRAVPHPDEHHVFEHICRDVRRDDMEAYRLLREGQTYVDLPEHLRRYRSDVFSDKYKRLAWDELCRSITAHIAKDGYWYIHPDQHRTLSIRETARVQSFPDDFRFAGTQTHRYRQIGNAVPVLLAESIGRAVARGLEQPRARAPRGRSEATRSRLLMWADERGGTTLPWRKGDADPWAVLLGELVLSRQQPEEAARLHRQLLDVAPSPSGLLARSNPVAAVEELGVRERAHLIVTIAGEIAEWYDGIVPGDEASLRALTGIGDNLSRAILAFAFGRRQVLVDTATARVASRITGHGDDRRFQLRLDLNRLAGAAGPDAAFSAALLDLGREVCVSDGPRCPECPIRSLCVTGRTSRRRPSQTPIPDEPTEVAA